MTTTLAKVKEENRLKEDAETAKANLTTELTALREKTNKAKADAVVEFCVFQPFFDMCSAYYGDGFDECLKQVEAAYPKLNLSQIMIDDIVPPRLEGEDIVNDETTNSIHSVKQKAKNTDARVVDQPISEGQTLLWPRPLWN